MHERKQNGLSLSSADNRPQLPPKILDNPRVFRNPQFQNHCHTAI